jgi:hypothetical protein
MTTTALLAFALLLLVAVSSTAAYPANQIVS